jgi:hypothetical protein
MTQDLTPEAVAKMMERLSDSLEIEAADMLEALAAKLAEVEADNADLRLNMDADLKTMCRERAALQAAEAEVARLRESREYRNGKHLLEAARQMGWADDGEGAFNFITRSAYAQGAEDAAALQPKETDQ